MARKLLLIRHAKAEPAAAPDAARELSGSGKRDARAAGRWLADQGFVPDHVVVSEAVRAVQTWDGIASTLLGSGDAVADPRVYDNTVDALLSVVADSPAGAATLALVGHNPSMHTLALLLDDGGGASKARTRMAASYPTMGIAVFEVVASWLEVGPGCGRLLAFEAPRA